MCDNAAFDPLLSHKGVPIICGTLAADPEFSFYYKDEFGFINGFSQNCYTFEGYDDDIEKVFADIATNRPDLQIVLHILCSPCSSGSHFLIEYKNGVQTAK